MNAASIVSALAQKDVQLWPEGDKLRFRAPKGVLTADDLARIKAHKPEILETLAGRKAVRLSAIQERLWFLSRLDTSGVGYTFTFAYRIEGLLDRAALADALQAVLGRHPGLRATFVEHGGFPLQLIDPGLSIDTPLFDAAGASIDEIERRIRTELVVPFDLEQGPLLRSALFRRSDHDHVWALTAHHLIADGRTFGVIVAEISALLTGGDAGEPPRLDYTDYLEWERARKGSPARAANLRYWLDGLRGAPDLDLPTDHPRPPVRTHEGGRVDLAVPRGLRARLAELAAAEGATLFSVLLSVTFALLLHETGHEDIAVGSPHANRPDSEFERTAGCFVSTLVLRADLSQHPSLREIVRRVSRTCEEAWDHQDCSYEELVAQLSPTRDTSRNALFQVFFALQNVLEELRAPNVRGELLPLDAGTVQFDLELYFFPAPGGELTGAFLYNRRLFDGATIRDMADRWVRLAEALLLAPDVPASEVSLLSESDRRNLDAWNRTDADYPRGSRADQLFSVQAAETPARTAVVFRGRRLTYAEVDRAAAVLAAELLDTVAPGERVGIFLDRSPEVVLSILAVARAGAAFVPLDPELPADRLSWMIEDSGIRTAITRSRLATRLPPGLTPLLVDERAAEIPSVDVPRGHDRRPTSPGDPAYVLYTSGSTGRPKGVEVGHRSLVNLLWAMARQPGLSAQDVLVAVTSLSFDISLLELLLPLIRGATLVIATRDEVSDPTRLAALLDTSGATAMQATPSMWRTLLDAGWPGREGLKALCGGEPLHRDLADRLLDRTLEVWNLYGPTETTIWSARWKVERGGSVLLGHPIENTRFHVVDARGALVPPGIVGELCIAGDGVALGYLHRADETARRFPEAGGLPGVPERAYRTGDLVRQARDGALVFMGRTDHQLKVRGHRVEPEEIEGALRTHACIREAVATLGPEGMLVAHVLVEPAAAPSERELREHVSGLLPTYMVPQRYVLHTELPLTPNGKIDRKMLSALPLSRPAETREVEPPADEFEAFVAGLFAEVLGLETVGRWDDFFQIGGHSLVTARVLHGVAERHEVRLELHELFQLPTVAALAARIRGAVERRADGERTLEDLLGRLDSMSEEEAQRLLVSLQGGPDVGALEA